VQFSPNSESKIMEKN